jgi:hypothetical protein
VFDAMLHWKLLRDAGVKIVTCQRGELDFENLGGMITAIVDQYGAREDSIKLAQRVAGGQKLKALAGQRIGGIAFGYDRELYDDTGKFVRRVHFRERFRKPATWQSKLVPVGTASFSAPSWSASTAGTACTAFDARNGASTFPSTSATLRPSGRRTTPTVPTRRFAASVWTGSFLT